MQDPKSTKTTPTPASTGNPGSAAPDKARDEISKEIGGREGPDPVRYGDWEKGGRCIDF